MIRRWVPDAVTVSRIAMTPVFVLTALATRPAVAAGLPSSALRAWTLVLLCAIAASDKLDGWLARRSPQPTTRRGAILDVVADRVALWSGVALFVGWAEPAFTPLPAWLALVLGAREVVLVTGWLRRRRGPPVSFEHEMHGRVATFALFLVLIGAAAAAPPAWVTAAAALAAGAAGYSAVRYAARMGGRRGVSKLDPGDGT